MLQGLCIMNERNTPIRSWLIISAVLENIRWKNLQRLRIRAFTLYNDFKSASYFDISLKRPWTMVLHHIYHKLIELVFHNTKCEPASCFDVFTLKNLNLWYFIIITRWHKEIIFIWVRLTVKLHCVTILQWFTRRSLGKGMFERAQARRWTLRLPLALSGAGV